MPERKTYHVTHQDGSWKVKPEGGQRSVKNFETKQQAVNLAIDLAKSNALGQVKIHKMDNTIQEERTYGKDPSKYEG